MGCSDLFALGVIVGPIVGLHRSGKTGDLFIRLIKMLTVPMVLFTCSGAPA